MRRQRWVPAASNVVIWRIPKPCCCRYELSWDVMEPVAYFVSLGTAIGFYLYFLLTNEAFDYQPLQHRLFSRWHNARLAKTNFDHQTYHQ